jgi:hypothetical protein
MYIARFSYDLLPSNRQRAVDFIHREVEAARANGLSAKLLVPLRGGSRRVRIAIRGRAKQSRSIGSIPAEWHQFDRGHSGLDSRIQ